MRKGKRPVSKGGSTSASSGRTKRTIASTRAPFEVTVRALRSDADLDWALAELDAVFDAAEGTQAHAKAEVLSTLIEAYENEHYPIAPPDPIEAILFRLEQRGLDRKALEGVIGSRGRVSEVLTGKRGLTLEMIRKLHATFDIPLGSLVGSLPA